jgi:hypothetical protein
MNKNTICLVWLYRKGLLGAFQGARAPNKIVYVPKKISSLSYLANAEIIGSKMDRESDEILTPNTGACVFVLYFKFATSIFALLTWG